MRYPFPRRQHYSLPERLSVVSVASLTTYLLVSVLDGVVVLGDFLLAPSAGLAIPFGVLFGVPAAFGLVVGVLAGDVLVWDISFNTLPHAFSIFLLAYLPHVLYRYGVGYSLASRGGVLTSVARFVLLGVVACCGAAAALAWGYELTGTAPFYVSFVASFVEYSLATSLTAPVVGVIVVDRRVWASYTVSYSEATVPPRGYRRLLVTVPPSWAVAGVVASVGFQIRESLPFSAFHRRGVGVLYRLVHPTTFGQGGRRAQVVLGTLLLFVLFASMSQCQRRTGGE